MKVWRDGEIVTHDFTGMTSGTSTIEVAEVISKAVSEYALATLGITDLALELPDSEPEP